jgi:ubiquinone/menaquinone biosynthesis C-methylase UbiE
MRTDEYTPGYSAPMIQFMAQRTAESHASFFLPYLKPGWSLLDAGCGPGTITLGLAQRVKPGHVVGIDAEDVQFGQTCATVQREGLNIEFRKGSVYQLPFEDRQFDAVFSHALLEHLSDPPAAIAEFRRVLKPGGLIGLRAGDLGGMLLDTDSEAPAQAFASYLAHQRQGEKDPHVGRKLARLMRQAGFSVEKMTASYEVISDLLMKLGPALAEQFTIPGSSCKLQDRSEPPSLFVALAWCEATGRVV